MSRPTSCWLHWNKQKRCNKAIYGNPLFHRNIIFSQNLMSSFLCRRDCFFISTSSTFGRWFVAEESYHSSFNIEEGDLWQTRFLLKLTSKGKIGAVSKSVVMWQPFILTLYLYFFCIFFLYFFCNCSCLCICIFCICIVFVFAFVFVLHRKVQLLICT